MSGRRAMQRGKPMARGKPLRSSSVLSRGTPLKQVSARRQQAPARRIAPRDTGPSRRVRDLVLARDSWQCVACGKPVGGALTWWSVQHRKARGQGGGNELSNLIAMCGSATSPGCHRRAEDRRREMQAAGYWLESWQDPRAEGVMIASEHGSGVTVWLDDLGGYLTEAPERAG